MLQREGATTLLNKDELPEVTEVVLCYVPELAVHQQSDRQIAVLVCLQLIPFTFFWINKWFRYPYYVSLGFLLPNAVWTSNCGGTLSKLYG